MVINLDSDVLISRPVTSAFISGRAVAAELAGLPPSQPLNQVLACLDELFAIAIFRRVECGMHLTRFIVCCNVRIMISVLYCCRVLLFVICFAILLLAL